MVICKLDSEVSGEFLGWELPTWTALLLHRVLPSCAGLVVYLTLICFDIALVCEHFLSNDRGIGIFLIILMVLPALLSLVFTLASPPPGLQTEDSAISIEIEKNDLKWIFIQIGNFLLFPIAAIGRYCHQVFWWVEAVCAARDEDDERTRNAIQIAKAPSPMELYLFLQAFIHSAPHIIVNVLDLMNRYSDPNFEKFSLVWVSVVMSSFRMASTATVYRRFEREKLCGRHYPWKTYSEELENSANEKTELVNKVEEQKQETEEENIYETLSPLHRTSVISQRSNHSRSKATSDMIQFSPRSNITEPFFDDEGCCTDSSSEYLPPIPVSQVSRRTSSLNSEDEYMRPISIIERVAPRRRDTQYTIQEVCVTPPPAMPAPRPGTLSMWAEKLVENAESIPTWLSAPPRRRHIEEIKDEPDVPRHVPGPLIMRGLEPQDASAALVHFLGWHMFFISRLLSMAAFINFFPFAAIIVLFSHYQIILLLLIVPQASTVRRGFYIFLAFIYLFCLMEFKIRFRHVRVWHVFWIIVCTIEIVVFTGLWAGINNKLNDWWRDFIVKIIIGSMLLSFMCFLVYFVLLKPRETVVYVKNKSNMEP
ncbi:uncharacterized protein LOC134663600 isoform X1 [Cydia fagiglandana]|uniref:uncharacterized protein LOC134663600 isoform X1 n=1 Tax=Cydia fagiglandana TaxID=1458189 RepID=UPI002FEDFBAC